MSWRGDQGSATLWVLATCLALLALGGVGLDLWRAVGERQTVAGIAEAAAAAGANALDEAALRQGQARPDPALATAAALAAVDAHPAAGHVTGRDATAGLDVVTVRVTGRLDLTLLRLLAAEDHLQVTVTASAQARRSG